jgi:asparagine synthase (glutamine-hydrolysing)
MCGIAGVLAHLSGRSVSMPRLQAMSSVLLHRGPDGDGHWCNQTATAGFAHRRLSIIDLSDAAAQPMLSEDERFVIVFNGEIYNYVELKDGLLREGVVFKTSSDTEVLLQLFIRHGAACLSMLDGMFAFAVWDNATGAFFAARDRFGEKPFYYSLKDGYFTFASEIKAIMAYFERLSPDWKLLQAHLDGSSTFDDVQTPFEEIVALPPSTWIQIRDGKLEEQKYWTINPDAEAITISKQEATEEFLRLFTSSVRLRLRSDVPVGSSLSGGLDSSSVVCCMAGLGHIHQHTFSARFHSEKDEGPWMDEVVGKTGVLRHDVWPDEKQFLSELGDITWHQEFPLASASVYAQWKVMQLPRAVGVKVLLDGQGADEYLCGYDELKYFAIWQLFREGKWSAFSRERKLFIDYYGQHGRLGAAFYFDPLLSMLGYKRKVFRNGYTLKQQLWHYTRNQLGALLRYADRNSMASSIEVRLPFLSHALVEFVFSLPENLIYHEGKTKYVLREALKPLLPEAIYNRTDKIGFAPPQKEWMRSPDFLRRTEDAGVLLLHHNLRPSTDGFKNLAVASFLTRFIR